MHYEEEIDLREILLVLRKNWRFIALITILAILISGIVSFFILQPLYEASSTILVGRKGEDSQTDYQDILLSQKLVTTYGEIIKTSSVLDQVIENQGLNLSVEGLSKKINVSPVKDTEIIRIKVTDQSAFTASNIANEISKVFSLQIQDIMNVDNISILEMASAPNNPIKPNKKLNIAIAAALGMMASIFLVFIKEYFDNTIKTPDDIARHLELPVLASIPQTQE
jgi:capsular polysaccharide biosynthesis protein